MQKEEKIVYESLLNMLSVDNYLTINMMVAKTIGLNNTVFLTYCITQLNYWYKNKGLKEFYQPQQIIEEYTTLSPAVQTKCIKELIEYGILKVQKKGIPAKNYYSIDPFNLRNLFLNNQVTSSEEIKEQETEFVRDININRENTNKGDISLSKDKEGNPPKESKKENINPKKLFDINILEFRSTYPEVEKKLNQYLDYRLRVRGIPDINDYQHQINRLKQLASKPISVMGGDTQYKFNQSLAIRIIDQSISGGKNGIYLDFYELDDPRALNEESFKEMDTIGNINITVTPPLIDNKEY